MNINPRRLLNPLIRSPHVPRQRIHRESVLAGSILLRAIRFRRNGPRRRSKGRIVRSLRVGDVPGVCWFPVRAGVVSVVACWTDEGDIAAFPCGAVGEIGGDARGDGFVTRAKGGYAGGDDADADFPGAPVPVVDAFPGGV